MKILKLSQKQFVKYLFLFTIAVFLVSSIFVCHIYTAETVNLAHASIQTSQTFLEDPHHSSDSCHSEEESLVSQNENQLLLTNNKIQAQDNQKFALDFNSETSEKSSSLVQRKDAFFISSENLEYSQTSQLLAVIKIE